MYLDHIVVCEWQSSDVINFKVHIELQDLEQLGEELSLLFAQFIGASQCGVARLDVQVRVLEQGMEEPARRHLRDQIDQQFDEAFAIENLVRLNCYLLRI